MYPLGQADALARIARQDRDRGKPRDGGQGGEKIAVILRDPAASAEPVGDQRQTGQTGAASQARHESSTICDQRRDASPFDGSRPG